MSARPTVTPAIDQGFFNVPSSGVYAGTSLYEFFWTNHCDAPVRHFAASSSDPLVLPAATMARILRTKGLEHESGLHLLRYHSGLRRFL